MAGSRFSFLERVIHMTKNSDGRKDRALEQLRASLTTDELERAKAAREFSEIAQGTPAFRVFLHADQLNLQLLKERIAIDKALASLAEYRASQVAVQQKLVAHRAKITVLSDSDLADTLVDELRFKYAIDSELNGLPLHFVELYRLVGHKRLDKTPVLTQEQFDGLFAEVEAKVRELGLQLPC